MNIKRKDDHHFALQRAFDTPWPGPQGEPVILENENLRLDVYPQDGARIVSLRAFGFEVLRQRTPQRRAFQYGCFPMVPWVGRLGNAALRLGDETYSLPANKPPHALHGMACYSHWEIGCQTAHSLTLHSQTGSPWPWKAAITQTLTLEGDALSLRIEIATSDAVFPAAAGWHPWFVKHLEENEASEALRLVFSPSWQEETGSDELPTGRHITPQTGPWDDCFGFKDGVEATLLWPDRLALQITSPAQSLVVFDKQPDATCVNPMTQPPNAINLAPQYVRPDAPLTIETRWSFKPDR